MQDTIEIPYVFVQFIIYSGMMYSIMDYEQILLVSLLLVLHLLIFQVLRNDEHVVYAQPQHLGYCFVDFLFDMEPLFWLLDSTAGNNLFPSNRTFTSNGIEK